MEIILKIAVEISRNSLYPLMTDGNINYIRVKIPFLVHI
jgi:hypothetical protein